MRRRWFIASLGAALLAPPRFGSTQSRVAQAAFLLSVSEVPSRDPPPFWQALVSGLRERGWEEGRNIAFHVRASGGSDERNHQFAAELAGLLPNARLKIYPDSAHGFLFQHHSRFAAEVHAFLEAAA